MAISSFKKLNKAFTTLHSTISTKEEISLTKKEKAITLNKNREGKEGQIAREDYEWQQRGRGRGWRNRGRRKEEGPY